MTAAELAHRDAAIVALTLALQGAKNSLVSFKLMPGNANAWEPHDEDALVALNAALEEYGATE